jgi:hypothetical protein
MASRIFALLAAVFLVGAVAIAALAPRALTLNAWLLQVDREVVRWMNAHSLPWVWSWVEEPFLLRPVWLLPACVGVVCAGLALTFNRGKSPSSRRRRS